MGIRGLSTFFEQNPDIAKTHYLHDTPVIFDGNNLLFKLYFSYNLDCIFGGDFNTFALKIKEYFSLFQECNIHPIVIFDGGLDKSDRKIEVILKRYKQRLSATQNISMKNKVFEKLLPVNAIHVFKDVISKMGIRHAQCEFEADDELAVLANHYKCPLASEDSDFYIFDLKYGFIHLQSIELMVSKYTDDYGTNFLKCKIYYLKNFLYFFPGIDKTVLPLFGILVGNDYADILNTFDNCFSTVNLPEFEPSQLNVDERQKIFVQVLHWLKDKTLQEAVQLVLPNREGDQREQVRHIVEQAIASYTLQKCNLTLVIENSDHTKAALQLNSKLTTPCGQPLPEWFIYQFNSAVFPSYFLNVILLHKIFLNCQVEDVALESSYMCSQYIRQVLYGILMRHNDDKLKQCKREECVRAVEEYDQERGNLKTNQVHPVFCTKDSTTLPMLAELNSIDVNSAKIFIRKILGEQSDCFLSVPRRWQLFIATIRYWLRNCKQRPSEEYICALVINLVYYSVLNRSFCKKEETVDSYDPSDVSVAFLIKQISPSVGDYTSHKFNKYLHQPIVNQENPLLLRIIYYFNQLQTCISYVIHLNRLFGSPFIDTQIQKSIDGIFMYNLNQKMISSSLSADVIISEILGENSALHHLYIKLKYIILEGECSSCVVKQKKKCSLNNRNSDRNQIGLPLSNRYNSLKLTDDDN